MKKVYQAVCCVTEAGEHWIPEAEGMQKADAPPDGDEGAATGRKVLWHSLTDYLVKDAKTNSSAVVTKDRKGAKEARLSMRLPRFILLPGAIIRSGCRWRMPDFRSLVIENIIRIGNCMQRRGW